MEGCPKTAQELQRALNEADTGSEIKLHPIEYKGDFIFNSRPGVTLTGTNDPRNNCTTIVGKATAIGLSSNDCTIQNLRIKAEEGVGLDINGDRNALKNLSIQGATFGVRVQGDNNEIANISISDGKHGIFVSGSSNQIKNCSVSKMSTSGLIVEEGNHTDIGNCSISKVEGDALVFKEGTSEGKVRNCSIDGFIELRGDKYDFKNTSMKGTVNVLGCENSFVNASLGNVFVGDRVSNKLGLTTSVIKYLDSPGHL